MRLKESALIGCVTALGSLLAGVLLEAAFHRYWTDELWFPPAVMLTITLAATWISPARGLQFLWVILALLWFAKLAPGWPEPESRVGDVVRGVPEAFEIWSVLALGAMAGTLVHLHRLSAPGLRRLERVALGVWLAVTITAAYLGSFPLDVGGTPMWKPQNFWVSALIILPTPFVIAVWAIRRTQAARQNSRVS